MSNTPIGRNYAQPSANTSNEKGAKWPPPQLSFAGLGESPEVWRAIRLRSEDRELDDAVLRDGVGSCCREKTVEVITIRIPHVKTSSRQVNEIAISNNGRCEINELVSIDQQVLQVEPVTTGIRYN